MSKKQQFIVRSKMIRGNAVNAVHALTSDPLMVVEIKPFKQGRSIAQNRLLWMWYGEIREHLAETTGEQYQNEDIHEFMKDKFLDRRAMTIKGDVRVIHGSTAQLNVTEMSEYLERLDIYCADELGLTLVHPDDTWHGAMGK